jgi:phosphoadenosine phosphosulfate reductase
VAWSGGRDSTVVVDLARRADPDVPVVWYDSGLEFPETRAYIDQLADAWDLNLNVIPAEPDALTVLVATGAWDHAASAGSDVPDLHHSLITAPAAIAHDLFGVGELTGLRAGESVGRRALLAPGRGTYTRSDGSQVLAPCWSWSSLDIRGYLAARELPDNPVYGRLAALGVPERAQRVGVVVDGNNPEHGRFAYLKAGWPDMWTELVAALPRLAEWR